jgi:hypothetical protein
MNRRTRRHLAAGSAAAVAYAAAWSAGSRPARLALLLGGGYVMALIQDPAAAKAKALENRVNNFLANGGTIGGTLDVNVLTVGGYTLSMHRPKPTQTLSGAPGSYDASWCSNLSSFASDLYTACKNAGIVT